MGPRRFVGGGLHPLELRCQVPCAAQYLVISRRPRVMFERSGIQPRAPKPRHLGRLRGRRPSSPVTARLHRAEPMGERGHHHRSRGGTCPPPGPTRGPPGGSPTTRASGRAMSWRGWDQSGLGDEAVEHVGPVLHAFQASTGQGCEFVDTAGGEVAQAVLQMRPHALGRIEVGYVGGETEDGEPLTASLRPWCTSIR